MKKDSLLVIGLSPALQKTLLFDSVSLNDINRAKEIFYSAGGKAVHTAIASSKFFSAVTLIHCTGGNNGEKLKELIFSQPFSKINIEIAESTRMCTTLLHDSMMTELIEPSPKLSKNEQSKILECIHEHSAQSDALILAGTYPKCFDHDFYTTVVNRTKKDCFVCLDAHQNVMPALKSSKVNLLKINQEELRKVTGLEDLHESVEQLLEDFPETTLAITDGPGTAWFFSRNVQYKYSIPKINCLNPIGAGDTVTGVTVAQFLSDYELDDAFQYGLAAATASCLSYIGADFSEEKALEIYRDIKKERVK